MRRRDALALFATTATTASAGCLDAIPLGAPSAATGPDVSYEFAVFSQDSLAREIPLEIEATVVEPAATAEHPARVQFTAESTADEPIEVRTGVSPVFAGFTDMADEPRVMLAPTGWDLEPVEDGCWRPAGSITRNDVVGSRTYEPGVPHVAERYVWAAPDREQGCVPEGEYRFEHGYAFGRGERPDRQFRWGFDATIVRP